MIEMSLVMAESTRVREGISSPFKYDVFFREYCCLLDQDGGREAEKTLLSAGLCRIFVRRKITLPFS